MGKKMKGVSPIIAVILLIAFTLMIAGIIAGWASRFVSTQRKTMELCSKAQIFIQKASYANGELTLLLFNSGKVDLSGFSIKVTYDNTTGVSFPANITIKKQNFETVKVAASSNIDELTVQSVQCDGVSDYLTKYDIQGI